MIRIGVIGCGYWGPNLIRNFSHLKGSDVVICSDLSEERLAHMRSLYPKLETTTDYRRVLAHKDVDAVVVDLQDVGTRIYTFAYTMSHVMEAAAELGKEVVVLDRPNPIDGVTVQGTMLDPAYRSFVGLYPMPTRHGLTMGEMARWMNERYRLTDAATR